MAHLRFSTRGLEINQARDQSAAPVGQILFQVRVKRWYLLMLLVQSLRAYRIPARYWPRVFWRVLRSKRHG